MPIRLLQYAYFDQMASKKFFLDGSGPERLTVLVYIMNLDTMERQKVIKRNLVGKLSLTGIKYNYLRNMIV